MQTDEGLAGRCLEGDEEAWEALIRRYHKGIWSVAYHYTGTIADADDLTQEIFVHILRVLDQFDPAGNLAAWLRRVARNHAIDHYRRHRRERQWTSESELPDVPAPAERTDPHVSLERKDLGAWLEACLKQLPEELREAVMLRDLHDLSYHEMADFLHVPLGTVKSRIHRGRLELARHLKRHRGQGDERL